MGLILLFDEQACEINGFCTEHVSNLDTMIAITGRVSAVCVIRGFIKIYQFLK